MSMPYYERPTHPRFALGATAVHVMKIVDFLRFVINRDGLSIGGYLEAMGQAPFFLVAATGLGKTVAVPVHVFIRLMQRLGENPDPQPRIWVVEPRIPIAVDQMRFMSSLWDEYLRAKKESKLPPLFGCISSASGNVNRDAPIKFVTTGIFELMAKTGELTPARDRVIIDEAHVTVEQNAGVELGIALARKAGIVVDYMSATVDTSTLEADLDIDTVIRADQQRYVIWKHNLLKPLHDALPSLIQATLIQPELSSEYYPNPHEYRHTQDVLSAVTETNRSHGLLAVVNSFAGEQSDVRRLTDIIRRSFPELPVLELASEVVRDARRVKEFQRRLATIEHARQNYVILATSVVEMGITFPTLDYIVTMDSGYDQETIGDVTFPVVAPLGVNSLLQRMGRVGRRRPGIAYISYETGADYAELEDEVLNRNGLRYERIQFPMAAAPLTTLAYYACKHAWHDLASWVADLRLPSRLHENADRMEYLGEQIDMLHSLGIAADNQVTPFGEQMEQWIGQADLAYAVQLQRRLNDGAELPEVMFWVVATALSNTPLVTLRAQHDFFVDYDDKHQAIAHDLDIWRGFDHEDLAACEVIGLTASLAPLSLLAGTQGVDDWDTFEFYRWCNLSGTDGRKLQKAGTAITDLWRVFCKINAGTNRFQDLFGDQNQPALASLPWHAFQLDLPISNIQQQLTGLPGVTEIAITENDFGGFEWQDTQHGHKGMLNQDDTPLRLAAGSYAARLVPSRESKAADTTWRLAHLGIGAPAVSHLVEVASSSPPVLPSPIKSGWRRFLDGLLGDQR